MAMTTTAMKTTAAAPFLIVETGQPVASMRRHGSFAHWIRCAAGLRHRQTVAVDVVNAHGGAATALPSADEFAGVIVSGSGAMVTQRLDWSEYTAHWLRDAAEAGVPVFGICYGHQLLAHALGGEVGDNPRGREMGTIAIDRLAAADGDPLFGVVPARFDAQATHLQTVLRPPTGATVLATSAQDDCHAFCWGRSRIGAAAWGVQFHPEFSAGHMRGYIRARADALQREGFDAQRLERQVGAAPAARRILRRFVRLAAMAG